MIGIKDITLFVILGLILITFGYYFNEKYRQFRLITELNILEDNNLKNIEVYIEILLYYSKSHSYKDKALISGVVKIFEENLRTNPELYEQYNKLLNDKNLQKKFSYYYELKILSLISIIYSYNIEKSKNDIITLNMCYFLINNFKNPLYAIWLCTKIKENNHIQSFYKYTLMEEIKGYLIKPLNKNKQNLAIKNIQISNVIIYNQYANLFKIKIYDATCSQIEYFDVLKNNITTVKTTENFLSIGEDILSLRRDIMYLWEKIILLNPFSDESKKDYMIYLDSILQDDILKINESKKYDNLKAEKMPEKNNLYYYMFNQDSSAVLLSDGYSYGGKILYATPNFPSLFMFTGKEILNTSIDDLLPDIIQAFHKYLIEDAIKFSNLSYIFKKQKDVLLKGKNGLIFNIYLYIKPVPDLSLGLIYFQYIEKIKEPNFIILLDENLKISGYTEMGQMGSNFTMDNHYGLTQLINGYHIGLIIPEILLQINYDTKSNSFYFSRYNIDLKGYLYPIHNPKQFNEKIIKILDTLKEKKMWELNNINKYRSFEEYDDLIKELNTNPQKPYSIFFRIVPHTFIHEKYKYYRIYITNDLLSWNENVLNMESKANSISDDINNNLKESMLQSKIKNNEDSSISSSLYKTVLKNKKTNISHNLIRLKTKLNRPSKILISKEVDDLNKDINNKEIKVNDENIDIKQNIKQINSEINKNLVDLSLQSMQDSSLTQINAETTEFNKLKQEIINKNDSFYTILIKIIGTFYFILIITLMFYDYFFIKKIIYSYVEFLRENLYFIHTKIATGCVYNSAVNLQFIKKGIIPNYNCPNSNCTLFYANLLEKCYTEVRVLKYNTSIFFPDYISKFFIIKFDAYLYIYNSTRIDHLNIDEDTYCNLLISHALKVIANLTNYFSGEDNEKSNVLEVYFKNLLSDSLRFFLAKEYDGFSKEEKAIKCNKLTNNPPLRIIISLILFLISTLIIFYLICKKNGIEIYFLDKLINFTSSNFDEYLKKLEEVKKKFRDDNNDEEDKNMDELEAKDIDEKNDFNSKKNDLDLERKKTNMKENSKKKKSKQNKIQQHRLKKRKIMSDYFIKYNLSFGLKMCIIFLISTLYFLILSITCDNMKKSYKKFDESLDELNDVFIHSFQTFLTFKEQIVNFAMTNNIMKIPTDSEIIKPKIGNALNYIINNSKYPKEFLNLIGQLYNKDACELMSNNNTKEYEYCKNLLSSILTKGLEQSIVQLSLIINNCVDELKSINKNKSLKELYFTNSTYSNYEMFMGYYMIESFLMTQNIFEVFRSDEENKMNRINNLILGIFIVFYIILIFCLMIFVYVFKKIEYSFLNFIGILPNKFITDDEGFYKAILKFGQNFY